MSVVERIERGEFIVHESDWDELVRLAKIGEKMRWVDGVPPAFGADERKWIIFEHLTPFTRATVYDTAVWLGKFYSEEKVKLAKRWALLPLPEPPREED
jgi:hypothetical protein